jgi:DNA (cytosine-5)-methyltransferase 1
VLDAQNFGVAQRRRRVFVVGCLGSWESAAKVLFESESLSGNIAKGRKSGEEVAGTITARFGNSRNNHEELAPIWPAKTASTLNASFGDKLGLENQHINSGAPLFVPAYVSDVSATLTASGAGFSRPGHTSTAHENYIAIPIHAQATQYKGGGANRNNDGKGNGLGVGKPGDPMNTLDTSSRHAVAQHYTFPADMNFPCSFTPNVSNTLLRHGTMSVSTNMAVRRLTEIECERLQGFPDNYTNIKENCPSGARYKALGNSMAVPVMRWIGERINNYERL